MAKVYSKNESPLVPLPTNAFIPQRDLDKSPVLEAKHLGIDFGGLTAVDDFNLTIGRTEIAGLIGPNGAGKTTVFNLLTKVYQPTRGTVLVDGMDTHGMTTAEELKKYPHKKIMSSLEELLEREPLPAAASPRNISVRRIALLLLLFAAFAAFFCFLIFI